MQVAVACIGLLAILGVSSATRKCKATKSWYAGLHGYQKSKGFGSHESLGSGVGHPSPNQICQCGDLAGIVLRDALELGTLEFKFCQSCSDGKNPAADSNFCKNNPKQLPCILEHTLPEECVAKVEYLVCCSGTTESTTTKSTTTPSTTTPSTTTPSTTTPSTTTESTTTISTTPTPYSSTTSIRY